MPIPPEWLGPYGVVALMIVIGVAVRAGQLLLPREIEYRDRIIDQLTETNAKHEATEASMRETIDRQAAMFAQALELLRGGRVTPG